MNNSQRARRRENLQRLLKPRHIAFVGGRAVEPCIVATRKAGFQGEIWAVHPKYETLDDVPCVTSLAELPEAPDATLIAVSRERTIDVVAELAALGAGGAVSIVGEYSESGAGGAALQERLVTAAGDLALVGPNCLGVMNQFDGAAVWGGDNVFQSVTEQGVALISQSGYIAYSITNVEQAFPLGYAISMGNQAVLDAADYIDAMLRDTRVRAIGLYLEGLVDVAALSEAALQAVERGIPLVVLKAGGTIASAELTYSHSGTLAVSNELWTALFQRLGMIEVSSPKQLVETLKLLGSDKPPAGKRVVAAANSGGYAAMIGEKGRALGLEFPVLSHAQRTALRERVPDLVSLLNPLDWNLQWASMSTPDTSDFGMEILLDERADVLLYFVDWPVQAEVADVWWPTLEGLIRLNQRSDKTVLIASVLPDGLPVALRERITAAGVVCLQGLDDALAVVAVAGGYARLRADVLADIAGREMFDALTILPQNTEFLDEAAGKTLLKPYGLNIPSGVHGSSEMILAKSDTLGYPLAVKLLNANLAHKNHAGAVRLNIQSSEGVEQAINTIKANVSAYDSSLATDSFLAECMVAQPRAEFIVGVKQELGLGHALIIGRGGTAVEELRDYALLLLPASVQQIKKAVSGLAITQKMRLDEAAQSALVSAVKAIATFALDNREQLVELDVNPIILDAAGTCTAVDALVRVRT
jgi:acyl-CoA synthetase (NDP forming)